MHPLTKYRKAHRPPLSKADLGRMLGLTRQYIHNVESGDRKLAVKHLPLAIERTGLPAGRSARPGRTPQGTGGMSTDDILNELVTGAGGRTVLVGKARGNGPGNTCGASIAAALIGSNASQVEAGGRMSDLDLTRLHKLCGMFGSAP
jgi:hypothetical protein